MKITLPGPFTLSKQASDDYYGDDEALAMAYADVVNEEVRDLAAAGADVVQLDEPWLRQDPDGANRYALRAIDRALEGVDVTTAIHLCFGYGFVVSHEKPKAYAFLSALADCSVDQISIEAAQPHLDPRSARGSHRQDDPVRRGRSVVERRRARRRARDRIRRALPWVRAGTPRRRTGLRHEVSRRATPRSGSCAAMVIAAESVRETL